MIGALPRRDHQRYDHEHGVRLTSVILWEACSPLAQPKGRSRVRQAHMHAVPTTKSDLDHHGDDHRTAAVSVAHPASDGAADHAADLLHVHHSVGRLVLQSLLDLRDGLSRTVPGRCRSHGRGSPGPAVTLPVVESTTTTTEMNPSSPRMRRSFSDDVGDRRRPTSRPRTRTRHGPHRRPWPGRRPGRPRRRPRRSRCGRRARR